MLSGSIALCWAPNCDLSASASQNARITGLRHHKHWLHLCPGVQSGPRCGSQAVAAGQRRLRRRARGPHTEANCRGRCPHRELGAPRPGIKPGWPRIPEPRPQPACTGASPAWHTATEEATRVSPPPPQLRERHSRRLARQSPTCCLAAALEMQGTLGQGPGLWCSVWAGSQPSPL